ncbi:SCNM1 protein, partial [Polyodon spathula]|nr:SCNM1 protein [Polyodon spathula]
MSFKREGNDPSQLNVLKKRRVAELLSHFIPEDEAALLKNGRYTCLVCSYRPVFDTVDMLTVHRAGKRHLEGLKWFYGKKRSFENEVAKRRHLDYLKAEEEGQQVITYHNSKKDKGKKKKTQPAGPTEPDPGTVERRRELEHYLKLKSKKDKGKKKKTQPAGPTEPDPGAVERRRELEHYLKLKR